MADPDNSPARQPMEARNDGQHDTVGSPRHRERGFIAEHAIHDTVMAKSHDDERSFLALGIAQDLIWCRADRDVHWPLVRSAEPFAELATARAGVLGIRRVADELPRVREGGMQRIGQVRHVQHLDGRYHRSEALLEGRSCAHRRCPVGLSGDSDDDRPVPKPIA